jgi:phosphomevalonate kinase
VYCFSLSVVSAPGKVLVTGGYLVLDPSYHGLVIGTNARFYTVIQSKPDGAEHGAIVVESPQFENSTWKYTCGLLGDIGVNVVPRYSNVSIASTCIFF